MANSVKIQENVVKNYIKDASEALEDASLSKQRQREQKMGKQKNKQKSVPHCSRLRYCDFLTSLIQN